MHFRGVLFDLPVVKGESEGDVSNMPTLGGIDAEIHWPTRSVRIGETGNSMRGRNRSHMRWADKHLALQSATRSRRSACRPRHDQGTSSRLPAAT